MASKQKTYTQPKLLGQIYTPIFIVEKILENITYNSSEVLKKTIIDPACGDGRFLIQIVKKIIFWSKNKEEIVENLSFVHGWDVDEEAIESCKNQLDELLEPHQIKINWKIFVKNSLENFTEFEGKFDFIVGNPPYIRIQHLELEQRKMIQSQFSFCKKGSTDIYIAFFELAYKLLNEDGKCGFITPNSYFFTSTAADCRDFFVEKNNIIQVSNYGEIQLFENASTYCAITIFGKKLSENIVFEKATSKEILEAVTLPYSILQKGQSWQLSTTKTQIINEKYNFLKDICKIHVGITTLCDKAYIFPIIAEENDKIVVVNSRLRGMIRIEKEILKPIIKGSTLKNGNEKIKEYVLFPYEKGELKTQIIKEEILSKKYPLAYEYLLSVKAELDARDNGEINTVAWYAFGRSQGLETSFGKKIIFSPMNLRPNFIYSDQEDSTFYSGYCIKYSENTEDLLEQLNSKRMEDFIAISSRDFRGGWKAYSKKTIEHFPIFS